MKCATISIRRKESDLTVAARFLYKALLSRWFYVPVGYLPQKPQLYTLPQGVKLGGRTVCTILVTTSLYDMIKTDADAILADFYIIPDKNRLNKIFSSVVKPVIVSIRNKFMTSSKLTETVKRLDASGAAGLYLGRKFPVPKLKQICSECTIPVFSASGQEIEEIKSKINSGVFAVCIQGKNISGDLMNLLRARSFDIPVIAFCNRSERLMGKSILSGVDAVIFKPCNPFKMEWEDLSYEETFHFLS